MKDFSRAKVYKLVKKGGGDELDDMYIGSTCMALCDRMTTHRMNARQGKQYPVCQWMRDVGVENVCIVLIENVPCASFEEQRMHEQRWIDELRPNLNSQDAYLSRERRLEKAREYAISHRDEQIKQCRTYYATHREKLLAQKRVYHVANRERILSYQRAWRDANRDWMATYRKANCDKINARKREYRCKLSSQRKSDAIANGNSAQRITQVDEGTG